MPNRSVPWVLPAIFISGFMVWGGFRLQAISPRWGEWGRPTAISKSAQDFDCQSSSGALPSPQDQVRRASRGKSGQSFLVFGGGGAPSYNEIAIEKNVLYFQRTLKVLGYDPAISPIYFANGTNGQATVRYLDAAGNEKFKVPAIPNTKGAATLENFQRWQQQAVGHPQNQPLFFYFTGHGQINRSNPDNNVMILWEEKFLSVQQFSRMLDQIPGQAPVVTMMSQCFSGSFANLIYKGGDPKQGIALKTRCGFFATIKTNPSVGCTPEVNEADYKDYSSSFFAGLSGRSRVGQAVSSADYNRDLRVSYAEAHAFAKVDEYTTDFPISTSEAWLQQYAATRKIRNSFLLRPMQEQMQSARPEQKYVLTALTQKLGWNLQRSFADNVKSSNIKQRPEEEQAYATRLAMELVNVGTEKLIRDAGDSPRIAILNRLLKCESGSWGY